MRSRGARETAISVAYTYRASPTQLIQQLNLQVAEVLPF